MNASGNTHLTQCPHCDTVFQVDDEQLQVAQGRVRCGCCQGVFDVFAHPYEQIGEDGVVAPREPSSNAQTWETDDVDDTPYIVATRDDPWTPDDDTGADTPNPEAEPDAVAAAVTATVANTDAAAAVEPQSEPAATAQVDHAVGTKLELPPIDIVAVLRDQLGDTAPPATIPPPSIAWTFLAMLLILALGGQYLFHIRADLAKLEAARPWLQKACRYVGCELPLRHAPEQIDLLSRDVISHPRIRNALLINATFVNLAGFVQAYPVLQISLSNESGTVVSMRRFQPEEYLAQGTRIGAGMSPGAPVRVVLELVEPTIPATSFQFEFF